MRYRFVHFCAGACLAALTVSGALWADSIDDAEARRRGIPVAQVQLENAREKNAQLEKQISDLEEQLKRLQASSSTASVSATAHNTDTQAANPGSPKKGTELTLDLGNSQTLKLVEIPPGSFVMGSPKTPTHHIRDEQLHEVTLTKPFYIGVTHVTVDQFDAFEKESAYKTTAELEGSTHDVDITDGRYAGADVKGRTWRNPAFEQKGNYPVQDVSWNDAVAFCDWLTKKSGKKVMLPTEAQWEYAARAGVKTLFPWGDNPDGGKGWANLADKNVDEKMFLNGTNFYFGEFFPWDDGYLHTSPVGSFKPNGFGLYDMLGNVKQWCQDGWKDYDGKPATDPLVPLGATGPILRGGSWLSNVEDSRLSSRAWLRRDSHDSTVGFRVTIQE